MSTAQHLPAMMAAIAPLLPLDDGSHWSPTHVPQWPRDYSKSEIARCRAIAAVALSTASHLLQTAPKEHV